MTFDHDPDRLIDAWLDEGPRSFSPRLLDRTLADIHTRPQRRRRFAPWRLPAMSLPMKTAAAAGLVLALAAGTGGLLPLLPRVSDGPAASPSASTPASPSPDASPVVSPVPAIDFLPDERPLVGPTWLLVGYAADSGYAAAVADAPATLTFAGDLTFRGSTGCRDISGALTRLSDLPPKRAMTEPASIVLDGYDEPACGEPVDTQDRALLDALSGTGGYHVTAGGYDQLASELLETELEPALLAHYQAWPDLVRLIIRDRSGEGTLIYAPTAGEGPRPSIAPAVSFSSGPQPFLDTPWVLVGWPDETGHYRSADLATPGSIQFTSSDGTERFSGSTGCRSVEGDWTGGAARGGSSTRTLGLSVDEPVARVTCPAGLVGQNAAMLQALRRARAVTVDVQGPDALGPDVTRADIEVLLWQHLTDHADLTRLILRDASGEATLIFAPYAGQG